MSRWSRTLLLPLVFVCLAFLLAACAGRPSAIEPIQEPMEPKQSATAGASAPAVTRMHGTPTGAPEALSGEKETSIPAPTAGGGIVTTDPTVAGEQGPGLSQLVMLAKEDLGRRLSVAVDEIELLEVEAVMWPDASLGCPQPGMMYAEVMTGGYLMVLAAGEEIFEYHTDRGQNMTLCEEKPWSGRPSKGLDATVDDGWPSQPREDDVIIVPPSKWKHP